MPLGDALESDKTGIVSTAIAAVMPYLNNVSPYIFAIVCMIVLGLLTQVVHNLILAVVFFRHWGKFAWIWAAILLFGLWSS